LKNVTFAISTVIDSPVCERCGAFGADASCLAERREIRFREDRGGPVLPIVMLKADRTRAQSCQLIKGRKVAKNLRAFSGRVGSCQLGEDIENGLFSVGLRSVSRDDVTGSPGRADSKGRNSQGCARCSLPIPLMPLLVLSGGMWLLKSSKASATGKSPRTHV
jgi:hypothetical protein